jgi:hypothetical protein
MRDARTLEVSLRGCGSTFGLKKRHDMFRQYSALLANVVLWQPKSKNGLAVASPFRSDCAHFALFERSPFRLMHEMERFANCWGLPIEAPVHRKCGTCSGSNSSTSISKPN